MKTRNEILATLPSCVPVETAAWGLCFVRQIKGAEFEHFMAIMEESEGSERLARLTVLGLCDAAGERILAPGDEPVIMDGPMEPLGEIATAFLELNGVTDAEKKSSSPPNSSPSSSQNSSATPIQAPLSERFRLGS